VRNIVAAIAQRLQKRRESVGSETHR
jgi:hypothetical protein